jgi:hypothetical protein
MGFISRPLHPQALRPASVLGRQVISNNSVAFSSGTTTSPGGSTAGGTFRVMYTTGQQQVTDIQVVFQNWASGSQTGEAGVPAAQTFSTVVLEIPGSSNQFLFFANGGLSATAQQYETVLTAPYKVVLAPGTTFFIRYFWSCPASTVVALPPPAVIPNSTWNNFATPAAANVAASGTGTTGLTANLTNMFMMPTAIIGTSGGISPATVGLFGDSLFDCGSNSDLSYSTWPATPLLASGLNLIKASIRGDLATGNTGDGFTRCRNLLLADCDIVIVGFGTNDLIAGASAATIIAAWKTMWNRYAMMGAQVYQTTVVPRTTGTFTTVQGQTVTASESIRRALNIYLRNPAGMGAGDSAMADGAGQLTGIIDVAALAETDITNATPNLNSPNYGGLWYCGPGNNVANTPDGIHPGHAFNAPLGACMPLGILGRRLLTQTQYP